MAEHQIYKIAGAVDIELGTPRANSVQYELALPEGAGNRTAGLVLFIPGFGADNDAAYSRKLCGWIADTFGLACVTVDYHARGCRVSSGATRQFKQPDADLLVSQCQAHGVAIDEGATPGVLLERLHKQYAAHVAAGRASEVITLTCGLVARGGELQNFGLMQALDHLHVLADLRNRIDFDHRNIIALGSSHGGYLGQLISKLAPNTLRAVFDNSGYTNAPLRYINGRAQKLPDYIERYSSVMRMYFYLDSMWSFDADAENFYHADAAALRSMSEPTHLQAMAKAGAQRTRYRCVHGPNDPIAPTQEKADCCEQLAQAGFDVQYQCMGPGDVDGRYVKSLEHGMGLSLRGFFERSMASLPEADLAGPADAWGGDDFGLETTLLYPGPDRTYRFSFDKTGVCATLA